MLIPNPLSANSVNEVSCDFICFDGLVTFVYETNTLISTN